MPTKHCYDSDDSSSRDCSRSCEIIRRCDKEKKCKKNNSCRNSRKHTIRGRDGKDGKDGRNGLDGKDGKNGENGCLLVSLEVTYIYVANLSDFCSYRLIGKLTAFLQLQEFS
jgi:hypothetical protein